MKRGKTTIWRASAMIARAMAARNRETGEMDVMA
jgi:hypothetical protein